LSDVKLYAIAWRGVDGGATPVQYAFNRPFTILSGFAGAAVAGNTLSLPDGNFYDGILQFNGTFNSLNVTSNATLDNAQAMTFYAASVPEPSAAILCALGVAAALYARRPRFAKPAAPVASCPHLARSAGVAEQRLRLAA
jgi:hypothetical protein